MISGLSSAPPSSAHFHATDDAERPGPPGQTRAHFPPASAAKFRGRDSGCGRCRRCSRQPRARPGARLLPGPSSTHGSTLPCSAMRGPTCSRTVARSTRQSTLNTFAPDSAAAVKQMAGRLRVENHRRIARANFFDQKLRGGQREFAVLVERQFAHPGVEKLHGGGARGDLRAQIAGRGARDAFQQDCETVPDRSKASSSRREIRLCRGLRSCSRPASTARPRSPAPARPVPVRERARESRPSGSAFPARDQTTESSWICAAVRRGDSITGPLSASSNGRPIAPAGIKISEKTMTASTPRMR